VAHEALEVGSGVNYREPSQPNLGYNNADAYPTYPVRMTRPKGKKYRRIEKGFFLKITELSAFFMKNFG
jgi:hypothetical protein